MLEGDNYFNVISLVNFIKICIENDMYKDILKNVNVSDWLVIKKNLEDLNFGVLLSDNKDESSLVYYISDKIPISDIFYKNLLQMNMMRSFIIDYNKYLYGMDILYHSKDRHTRKKVMS